MSLSHRPRLVARSQDERGETLIELMATVVLLGVSIVALVGALFGAIRTTSNHKRATRAGNEAVNVAEFLRNQNYIPCGLPADYMALVNAAVTSGALPPPPKNTVYSIPTLRRLVTTTTGTAQWGTSAGACVAANDQGAQQITVRVTSTNPKVAGPGVTANANAGRISRQLTFVKRKKACPGAAATDPELC